VLESGDGKGPVTAHAPASGGEYATEVTPPVSLVMLVSRNLVISEYPAALSAAVSTRFGIGVPANDTGGKLIAVPSWPVRVTEASHRDGDVVESPVAGYVSFSAQESTFWSDPYTRDWVVMPVSA